VKPIFVCVAGTILLVGCTRPAEPPAEQFVLDWNHAPAEPPLPVNYPPDAFVVRWTGADPVIDPKVAADRHCQAWDGHAELVAVYASGNESAAEFVCKGLPKRWWEF
jgi:hypothetical protein